MAEKQKVLIVDDDANIAKLISLYPTKECYETVTVRDSEEALRVFPEFRPNLVLLDLAFPGVDGYQVRQELRSASQMLVIMLSAKGETSNKVLDLELGVGNYMIKSFNSKKLVARARTVLRHYQAASAPMPSSTQQQGGYVEHPNLVVDLVDRFVVYMSHSVEISPKGLELLYFLTLSSDQVFTREQPLNRIWSCRYIGDIRTVDIHIKYLWEEIKDHTNWAVTTV